MKANDRTKFLSIVIGFAELKGKSLSQPALELFWNSMQAWTIEEFQSAANHLITTCEFMPTPKDFEDLRRAGRPTAGELWAVILAAARTSDTDVFVEPAAAKALAAIGGLRAVMMSNTDSTHFLERRFAEHFEQMRDVVDTREALPALASPNTRHITGPVEARQIAWKLLSQTGKTGN